ncbi:ATP-dependent protease ATPase subunit HslU [Pediococcus argentinicus]|uniref:ATP-dependent protease ATPase subunit HslU n=1 Tax=Pediococcus argentinicus TaxID=480391 RepID=UPI00338FB423
MNNTNLTPQEIVNELNQFVIGQNDAKRAVAIALRNRYRRMQLSSDMQEDVTPKNLLMIGPTGVGKTEIARRLAKIVNAPFVKVEATKFTEVGYVGRDVESMVRDLVENAVRIEENHEFKDVRLDATKNADKRIVELLVPEPVSESANQADFNSIMQMMNQLQKGQTPNVNVPNHQVSDDIKQKRQEKADQLAKGLLENDQVTIEMDDPKQSNSNNMMGQMGIDLGDSLNGLMPKKKITRTLSVSEAREVLIREESDKLLNHGDLYHSAIQRAEDMGIIFIDEIDKIAKSGQQSSGDVSRQGVQRDILPIVEGSQVSTKYGTIDTSHILFIASGAFQETKPSDLIAELQGRFPIRVELDDLTKDDFVKILTEPKNALVKQYIALIDTDNVKVTFTIEAINRIAEIAEKVNHETENIGARRLHTILERLLEDILFEGPSMEMGEITITESYVNDKIGSIAENRDLSEFIL